MGSHSHILAVLGLNSATEVDSESLLVSLGNRIKLTNESARRRPEINQSIKF